MSPNFRQLRLHCSHILEPTLGYLCRYVECLVLTSIQLRSRIIRTPKDISSRERFRTQIYARTNGHQESYPGGVFLEFISILTVSISARTGTILPQAQSTLPQHSCFLQRRVSRNYSLCCCSVSLFAGECIQKRRETSNNEHSVIDAADSPFLQLQCALVPRCVKQTFLRPPTPCVHIRSSQSLH